MTNTWSDAKLGQEAFEFSGRNVVVMGAGWSVGPRGRPGVRGSRRRRRRHHRDHGWR